MTPDAALDHLAFFVGLRLMGSDARRRLRIALLRHKDAAAPRHSPVERLERLEALLEGGRAPETLQDRLDLARAQQERSAGPFDACFWLARSAELMDAGFSPQQAVQIVNEVRARVDPADGTASNTAEQEEDIHAG